MTKPRTIELPTGQRVAWRDLLALREAQAAPKVEQAGLFGELPEDHKPALQRDAASRYLNPGLFDL